MYRSLAALAVAASAASSLQAQFPPDSLQNLKFFPKNTPVRQLIDTMRGFSFALGVRCEHCHVGEEDRPLSEFDFASDEKRTKRTARVMLEMVRTINTAHLSEVPERPEPAVEVTCVTCHRGVPRPRALEDLLAETVATSGVDSAMAAYRALRDEYYGSAAYDFQERTLNTVGTRLVRSGKPNEALAILRLNDEMFPQSATIQFLMGEAYRVAADTAAAISAYERAVTLDPQFRATVERAIRALRGGGGEVGARAAPAMGAADLTAHSPSASISLAPRPTAKCRARLRA